MKCPRCGKPIDSTNCSCIYCGATIIQRQQDSDMNERLEKAQKIEYALLREIRQAFPDEIIDLSQWNHSRWDKPTAFVCRELGYKSVHSFLESHGCLVLSLQQNPYEDSYADSPIINNEHSRVRNNPPPVKQKKAETASRRVLPVMILCSIVLLFVLAAFLFVKIIGSSREEPDDLQKKASAFSGISNPENKTESVDTNDILFERNGEPPANYLDKLSTVHTGDIVSWGYYEQDNNHTNGKEPIEWVVLSVEDNMALVISRDALDWQPFHTVNTWITWEESYLREWLNQEFLYNAFSEEEISRIPTVLVPARQDDPMDPFSDDPYKFVGNDTYDKVFVLSRVEAQMYFPTEKSRVCGCSAYANAHCRSPWSNGFNPGWWLRNKSDSPGFQPAVEGDGRISLGCGFENVDIFVRPVMWITVSGLVQP